MHSAYALRYLGSRRWIWLALLHFVWRGEREGCQPNPFIRTISDEHGDRVGLATYLRRRDIWMSVPGPFFDPAWYAAQSAVPASMHPFVHFWRNGFDKAVSPTSTFDLAFFRDVVALFRPDKKEFAFERLTTASLPAFPRNEADLSARQQRFRDAIRFDVIQTTRQPRRRLVYIQAKHDFSIPWRGERRSFDIMLNVYDNTLPPVGSEADVIVKQNGTKATAVHTLMVRRPDLLTPYEAVLFLDDDIELSAPAIERAFDLFAAHGLDLAQTSLTADSACAFASLKQPEAGVGVRPISTVEIMMPLLSRRALETCHEAFGQAISGWGVDALLAQDVRRTFGNTIALLADVEARHSRPTDVEDGAYYKYLAGFGIEPAHELGSLARRFAIPVTPDAYCVFVDAA